jgi:hypothetical protein
MERTCTHADLLVANERAMTTSQTSGEERFDEKEGDTEN